MAAVWCLLLTTIGISGFGHAAADVARSLEYTIEEEQPTGSTVGNVGSDSGILQQHGGTDLRFSFRSGESRDLFEINERTGVMTTARVVDRDRKCASTATCDVIADVTARSANYFRLIRVVVHITDINDNSPVFRRVDSTGHVTLHVTESTPPGTVFALPRADDADSAENGVTEYQLRESDDVTGTAPFQLVVTDQADGTKEVRLRLLSRLDRESVSRYTFSVIALDGGQARRSAELFVDVIVTDANDNIPVFDRSSYEAEVDEDTPEMTSFIRVHATDADEGDNGHVTYQLAEHTRNTYGSVFGVDSETGEVFIRSHLDYELQQVYQLTIMATDQGIGALPVFTKLTVRVADVNDNPPVITVNSLTGSDVAEVTEHSDPSGTFVAHIAVTDADSGRAGSTTCHLEDENYFRLEPLLDIGEYKLITATTFDREVRDEYSVTLSCRDLGTPPLSTDVIIVVRVADINDHAPLLPVDVIRLSVAENTPRQTVLATINATDADTGVNSELRYQLSTGNALTGNGSSFDGHVLMINPATGVISTNKTFDYEEGPNRFRFLLTVSDGGDPKRSATATLLLTVDDVNDELPVFDRHVYHVTIPEDVDVGASIARVNATDRDVTAEFRHVTYSLPVPCDTFQVERDSGILRTTRALDRERQSTYSLDITATDGSTSTTPVTARVVINVDDVNDNRPLMDTTIKIQLYASRGDLNYGSLVTRLVATDADRGRNGAVKYAVEYGNEEGQFAVDPSTGAVTVAAPNGLDHTRHFYRLVVSATDSGTPPLQSVSDLEIHVNGSVPSDPAALESSKLADPSNIILLSGLVVAVILVLILIIVTVICFRNFSRRRRKYLSVKRDQPLSDLSLKTFPDVGGPTQSYHTGCDLGLSASDSVCFCRDVSSVRSRDDEASVNSRTGAGSSRCTCDVIDVTSARKMATLNTSIESDHHRHRYSAEGCGSRDRGMTSPSPSCCGSCCEVHSARSGGGKTPHHHHPHHHHHHRRHHRHHGAQYQRPHRSRPRHAATSGSSCSRSSSSAASSPQSLRRFPFPVTSSSDATAGHDTTSGLSSSPFELRRLPDMLKTLTLRCDIDDVTRSGGTSRRGMTSSTAKQLPVGSLGDCDLNSSSTSCADSGRGLSCDVTDEHRKDSLPAHPGPVFDLCRPSPLPPPPPSLLSFSAITSVGKSGGDAV